MNTELKFGMPSKGRLQSEAENLIKNVGFIYERTSRQSVVETAATEGKLILAFMRPTDIVKAVIDGQLGMGIVGLNTYLEESSGLDPTIRSEKDIRYQLLNFGNCRLSLIADKQLAGSDPSVFEGKRIATGLPRTTRQYFDQLGVSVKIQEIDGAAETQIMMGWADAVTDMVETGGSLRENGLVEIDTLYESQAIMIANIDEANKSPLELGARLWMSTF